MENEKAAETYHDLATNSREKTQYFFLENILKARIALHLKTGRNAYDEEINMYLAELLKSLAGPCGFTENKPYLSPFDVDVNSYLSGHPDARTEYVVYKENADYGLAATTVFFEYHHRGSYWHNFMQHAGSTGRIGTYYRLAASALAHLRGTHTTSVHMFLALADHIGEASQIIRKISGDCFEFLEKLSAGSVFHLEKELSDAARDKMYHEKLDDFIAAYQCHRQNGSEENRVRVLRLASELKTLNPNFRFDEPAL